MTAKRFLAGLRRLGYSTHNAHKLMSLSRTTIFRIAKGTTRRSPDRCETTRHV